MLTSYFATFPAGTYDLITKSLKAFPINELKIVGHDKSSVSFESIWPIERLIEVRYFTNVYLVVDDAARAKAAIKGKYFRLMMLRDGAPQPIDGAERARTETEIRRNFGLKPNTHLSRNDFYLIERSSGTKLLTLRLAQAKFKREKLAAGELRPELAHLLCVAAGLKAKHTVLDMFAGYGSIPLEAVRGFGCKQVVAIDTQKSPGRHEHPSITWHQADACQLDFLADDSVDRIITDPPWGIYDTKTDDLKALYSDFTKELQRILKSDGVAVVLSSFGQAEECFTQAKHLNLLNHWPILVSGKKATIYKLQKVRSEISSEIFSN